MSRTPSPAVPSLTIVCALLVALLAAQPALALSVTPAKIIIDTPGEHTFAVTVRSEGEGGVVGIRAQGDLADRISFSSTSEEFAGDVRFEGTIDVPGGIEPGDHGQEIILTVQSGAGDVVGASAEVSVLLLVRQTYPGPYLVLEAHAAPDEGVIDTTNLYLSLENRGEAAATPKVTVVRSGSQERIPAPEIPARGSAQLATILRGRGEETITILVEGAQPLQKELAVAIGHPLIEELRASAIPESGSITPIEVRARVDWNAPVKGVLQVGGQSYDIVIDGEHTGRYYVETAEQSVPVALSIGRERSAVNVTLGESYAMPEQRSLRWEYVALIILLLLVPAVIYLLRRQAAAQQ